MNFFHGCTALITGASSGIGAEFARQLAPHARALILVARRRDRLAQLKAEIDRPGLTVHCHAADLADEVQIEALLAALAASGERVTFLINNAGVGDHGFFENSDWPRVKAMIEVNIQALTRLTHALLPEFIRAGRGAILNVSSISSYLPLPKTAVYAASKAYVTSFTEALPDSVHDHIPRILPMTDPIFPAHLLPMTMLLLSASERYAPDLASSPGSLPHAPSHSAASRRRSRCLEREGAPASSGRPAA